jgi:hypothetical protein
MTRVTVAENPKPGRRTVSSEIDPKWPWAEKLPRSTEQPANAVREQDGEQEGERDTTLADARAEIARTRDEVALSVVELQRELARTADWRTWVARKPILSLSLAFGFGFALGHRWRRAP